MKTFLLIVILLVGGIIAFVYVEKGELISYERGASTVEVIEEPKEAWMTDEEAVKAAQDVIKRKQLKTELTILDTTFDSLTAKYEEDVKNYKAKKIELEKELGTY